jgi:hypothetical protein
MMGADIVRISNKSYRVKYREVTEDGKVNFYSEEIISKSFSGLKLCEIE